MQIIAHRGASFDAPENTIVAARLAWAQHADALEVDVHLTADGRLAVIHDDDTHRTAGVSRRVADSTLAELQQLDVGRWKDARFVGEKIPALGDVFAIVPDGKRIFVELKAGLQAVPELRRCIEHALRTQPVPLHAEQIAVISFDLAVATAAKRALPAHEVCWIADYGAEAPKPALDEIILAARDAGLDGVDVEARWITSGTSPSHERKAGKIYVWTVDDAVTARAALAAGVDGITTNRPRWLRTELAG